ncbi:unnamed protein product [Didymodactylos carnosus]|uniref:Uncharacterized protein n=1 Tax=Didymodactylos carnosus TaxID=1234261 RepID=A0A814MVT0_9BILA|nr:unnamed protein product [Didymodactylos carnosus]CAF3849416.1 unnamed protein product [Didymodactylos carnosus]
MHYIHNGESFVTAKSIKNDQFIYFGGETIYVKEKLIDFQTQLVQGHMPFASFTQAFNTKIDILRENADDTTSSPVQRTTTYRQNRTSILRKRRSTMTTMNDKHFQITYMIYELMQKGDNRFCYGHKPSLAKKPAVQKINSGPLLTQKQLKLALEAEKGVNDARKEHLCNVVRGDANNKSVSNYGILVTFSNCSVILGFDELARSESMRRVVRHLLRILKNGELPNLGMYDTACMLKLFISNWFNTKYLKKSKRTIFLSRMKLVIDRFHKENHKRDMCKTVMRADHPSHNGAFKNIDSQVAERMFSYLTNFSHCVRGYSYPKSPAFFMILFHLKNCRTTNINPNAQRIGLRVLPKNSQNNKAYLFATLCLDPSFTSDLSGTSSIHTFITGFTRRLLNRTVVQSASTSTETNIDSGNLLRSIKRKRDDKSGTTQTKKKFKK